MMENRYLYQQLTRDLQSKFVLLSGPRQVGKTTLAKTLPLSSTYLNYDNGEHRLIIRRKEWDRQKDLLILDELHKMRDWKRFLKGIYDVEGTRPPILVTGSARLDIAKRMGDSLAGRFFSWRLHPLCVKELLVHGIPPAESFKKLLQLSGFPEPYFNGNVDFYRRWATSHLDIIIRQDLIQLEKVSDLASLESLIELLANQVGSEVSYQSLGRTLERDGGTIKRWLTVLENLFIIFRVTPWSKNIRKSMVKAPKFYFFDTARVRGGEGAKFENLVACALKKEIDFLYDAKGIAASLHYLRTRDGHELDFLVQRANKPMMIVETKWSEDKFSPHFGWFSRYFNREEVKSYQLFAEGREEKESAHGTKLVRADEWLAKLALAAETPHGA